MIENRDYMRESVSGYRRPLTVTVSLLVVNVIAFLVQCAYYGYPLQIPSNDYFALSLEGLRNGYLWQLVTFQFMHAGILHLVFNCLAIYMFGRNVEEALGGKGFVTMYFVSGVVGGAVQMLGAVILPNLFGQSVVGASAGATGLVAAFAMLYPNRPVTMFLYFVPITLKAKYVLMLVAGYALFGIVFLRDHVAHAAHVGGMLMGIFYIKQIIHWNWRWPRVRFTTRNPPPRELANVTASKLQGWRRQQKQRDEPLSTEEFLSREVDPILDKISQHGIHSLTERERKILDAARRKMEKR